jgi:hypothetical protein
MLNLKITQFPMGKQSFHTNALAENGVDGQILLLP